MWRFSHHFWSNSVNCKLSQASIPHHLIFILVTDTKTTRTDNQTHSITMPCKSHLLFCMCEFQRLFYCFLFLNDMICFFFPLHIDDNEIRLMKFAHGIFYSDLFSSLFFGFKPQFLVSGKNSKYDFQCCIIRFVALLPWILEVFGTLKLLVDLITVFENHPKKSHFTTLRAKRAKFTFWV